MKRPIKSAFLIIGIVFLIIGITNNSTFLATGAVFVVIGALKINRGRGRG